MNSSLRCVKCENSETEADEEFKLATCRVCGDKRQIILASKLMPNPKNPRSITKAELNKLKRSIIEFGFVDPVIVNTYPGRELYVVAGHQRLEAAKELQMLVVPVVYIKAAEDKEQLLNMALNSISGQWDDEKLASLLSELMGKDVDVTLSGLDEPFIDEILSRFEKEQDESLLDSAPPLPSVPISKCGEIYRCGDSFIMCGDATKPEDVKRLMSSAFNDVVADLVVTDPPYGVSYRGTNNPNGKEWGVMQNDDLRGSDLYDFLLPLFKNYATYAKPEAALYSMTVNANYSIFEAALKDASFRIKQTLVWHKQHVLGHSDYHYSYEPIIYACKEGFQPEWCGDRTHKTVILDSQPEDLDKLTKEQAIDLLRNIKLNSDFLEVKKDPPTSYMHPTQKPVELSRIMIKNSSRPRQTVLDFCLGSGSTLIACESTQRILYGMEIDPKYVDVILSRYAAFSGIEPVRLSDGKSWKTIREEAKAA